MDLLAHRSRAHKTVISNKAPGRILEQGRETISLVDYVKKRDRIGFIEVVKTLADAVNLEFPGGDLDQENYQKYKSRAKLLEESNNYLSNFKVF